MLSVKESLPEAYREVHTQAAQISLKARKN
jgi:hypothetical protein